MAVVRPARWPSKELLRDWFARDGPGTSAGAIASRTPPRRSPKKKEEAASGRGQPLQPPQVTRGVRNRAVSSWCDAHEMMLPIGQQHGDLSRVRDALAFGVFSKRVNTDEMEGHVPFLIFSAAASNVANAASHLALHSIALAE